jgi:hypothetical protein
MEAQTMTSRLPAPPIAPAYEAKTTAKPEEEEVGPHTYTHTHTHPPTHTHTHTHTHTPQHTHTLTGGGRGRGHKRGRVLDDGIGVFASGLLANAGTRRRQVR